MKHLLSSYELIDVQEARTPQDLHRASLGVWLKGMLGDHTLDQRGQRGVLITVPFGPEVGLFRDELPRLLAVAPWGEVSSIVDLHPSYDPSTRVRLLGLPGVAPDAVEAWKTLAPDAPTVWVDLYKPTWDDALMVMGQLGGVLDIEGDYIEPSPQVRSMMAWAEKFTGQPVLVGLAAIEGIRPASGRFANPEGGHA
ncbi:MAG: hypothetical protein JST38_12820 [Bacteroidetes bacterium]|nr:hypothetical protein [Bacteroidota bacterium]